MSEHARLSPSSADKWTLCPGAISAERGHKDTDSEAAKQGTGAHELLELVLKREVEDVLAEIGRVMENGTVMTAEDVEAVKVAEEYIVNRKFTQMYSEMKLSMEVPLARDDIWGTADVIGVDGTLLEVIDYKHGKGISVEIEGNLQLILYAIGALEIAELHGQDIAFSTVRMTIIQPRLGHEDGYIRSSDMPVETLYEWQHWFRYKAGLTDDPDAPREAGEKQCQWCLAKPTCGALAEFTMSKTLAIFDKATLEIEPESLLRKPGDLNPEQLRTVLDNTKLITSWVKAVNEYALKRANSGEEVLGYKVVAGRKSKSFITDDDGVMKALRKLKKTNGMKLAKADITVTKLLSPSQALAKLKPLITPESFERVEELIVVNDGSPTLAPHTDRRPALPSKVEAAFGDIELKQKEGEQVDLSFLS